MDWPSDSSNFFPEKSEESFSKIDDDLDYAIALSLQEEHAAEIEGKSEEFLNKIDEDLDYAYALSLQEELSKEKKEEDIKQPSSTALSKSASLSIVDEQWEVLDPTPNIHALFLQFNVQFFYGKLDGVEVKWSPRMTLCAGVCSYEGRGGLCSVRLSLPLLKLRPRRDLVETLLHEMIHAFLFVTANNKDHNAHGPEFLKHMNRINKETGTKISVYHSFHDEVDLYRKHIWRCNGPCQKKHPYYGYVKRACNRAPGPNDPWWAQHKSSCGGTYTKIGEPENYKKPTKSNQNVPVKRKPLRDTDNQLSNIKKYLKTPSSTAVSESATRSAKNHSETSKIKEGINLTENKISVVALPNNSTPASTSYNTDNVRAFTGHGFLLGSSSSPVPKTFLANVRREIASSSGASNNFLPNVRQEIASSGLKSSAQTIGDKNKSKQKESCILGVIPTTWSNGGKEDLPKNKYEHQKTNNNTSNKSSYVQSSIEKFVSSPSRSVMGNNINNTTKDSNSISPPNVKCPVCFKMFKSSEINVHLDTCLLS